MAASGSGTAGRKGRGTVGARVPAVGQANVSKRLVALSRDTCLSIEPRAWLTISDIAIRTSKASAPPLVPAYRQVRPRYLKASTSIGYTC